MIRLFLRFWDWLFNHTHSRCIGCGSMDEDLKGECVLYGVPHSEVTVDRFGEMK